MNQLTTIASLPGTGGGCASALPAETVKRGSLTPIEAILTQGAVEVGQPVPWESTHHSIDSMTWDGRRWLHRGMPKGGLDLLDTSEGGQ